MKKCLYILLLILCFNLHAEPLYKVDVIVFSHLTATGFAAEEWPNAPTLPDMAKVIALSAPSMSGKLAVYQALSSAHFSLRRDAGALNRARGYKILTQIAWLQSGRSTRLAKRIHITGGKIFNSEQGGIPELNGYIRVSRPAAFQVDTNLVLTLPREEIKAIMPQWGAPESFYHFVLTQSEHLKLNEIFYLDHPLFGVIIQISRFAK